MSEKKPNSNPSLRPAAFLDRDGVLIFDSGYVFKADDIQILSDVPQTLKALQDRGYLLIVISNQAGVARGYFGEDDVRAFHKELALRIEKESGAKIDAFYYCPHHPEAKVAEYRKNCECRKPGTAMIRDAQRDFAIDLSQSFFVGDRSSDIDCAINANVRGFQIHSDQYEMHTKPFANIKSLKDILNYV